MFSDPSTWFTMILPQLTLLLLMIALIAVGALAYTFQRRDRDSDKQLAITKKEFGYSRRELERSEKAVTRLAEDNQRLQAQVEKWKAKHGELYTDFERLYKDGMLERWFTFIQKTTFRNRSELGAYLLYPMLWFLEYPERAFFLDQPVRLVGGGGAPTYVNCIVYSVNPDGVDVPLFLLETISPDQSFTNNVIDEITLKAYSAQVIKFGMTNGEEFILYNLRNRGTAGGSFKQFPLKKLRENWQFLRGELHPGAFPL